jgi:plasmid stability protein
MPALHIRNVDDAVISALKERARQSNRSLEGELREILREAAFGRASRVSEPVTIHTVSVPSDSSYGREDIYDDQGR